MPNAKAALAALAALVVLVAVLLLLKPGANRGQEPLPTAAPRLLALAAADVTRVQVTSPEGELVLAKSTEGAWMVEAPVSSAANHPLVEETIAPLADLTITRTLPPDTASLVEYGLEPPRFTVTLNPGATNQVVIEVGGYNPDSTKRYVRIQGNPAVHLVFSYQLDRLSSMIADPPLALPTPTLVPEVTGAATQPTP
jgi:hypothetical protein